MASVFCSQWSLQNKRGKLQGCSSAKTEKLLPISMQVPALTHLLPPCQGLNPPSQQVPAYPLSPASQFPIFKPFPCPPSPKANVRASYGQKQLKQKTVPGCFVEHGRGSSSRHGQGRDNAAGIKRAGLPKAIKMPQEDEFF